MKYAKASLFLLGIAFCLRADLPLWIRHLPAGPLHDALFRPVDMPWGKERARRLPEEARAALTQNIASAPRQAELYRLRAREEERQLDFTAAEADWRRYASLATNRTAAWNEAANYFHRRNLVQAELQALDEAGLGADDPARNAASEQEAWKAFVQAVEVAGDHLLPAEPQFRAWIKRYPTEAEPRQKLIAYLSEVGDAKKALAEIEAYQRAFPLDRIYPVEARATLALYRGSEADALAVYERAFQPLWPAELRHGYFALIEQAGRRREFLTDARKRREARPGDIDATARLFDLAFERQDLGEARRAVVEYRNWKEGHGAAWRGEELQTLAEEFRLLNDINETARCYYALYSSPGASPEQAELALSGLANLLLDAPDQPIAFGAGNLSLYRDIGTMDATPGFLNGILSLVLNGTGPSWAYNAEDAKAAAYFHRSAAAELTALLDRRFPQSPHRADLHAKLIAAFAAYGQRDKVLKQGEEFLGAFPQAGQRVAVAMHMADALAATEDVPRELALYDRMLKELGVKTKGLPLGRSEDYIHVLDRYLARLTGMKRTLDALAVYRREIDRNPQDPGLYERLAAYLEQNGLGQQVEQVYQNALKRFPGPDWTHKLARWYLRQQRIEDLAKLSRSVVRVFSGSELEAYFQTVNIQQASLDRSLFLELNRFAHQRFPEDMQLVKNLMQDSNSQARWALLRSYWQNDAGLKRMYFEELSHAGDLEENLAAVRKENPDLRANPLAAEFVAEAEAWRSHFEAAAPAFQLLARQAPGDSPANEQALAVSRSLATMDPVLTEQAVSFARNIQRSDESNTEALAAIGDVYADREHFTRARPYWEQMARVHPGSPEGYLQASTIFWDYFQFSDALRMLDEGRRGLEQPALHAYEAGAIREGARQYPEAIQEYLAAVAANGSESPAFQRLVRLARRPALRDLVERATASGVPDGQVRAELRLKVLLAAQRNAKAEEELFVWLRTWSSPALLQWAESTGRENGFEGVVQRSIERQIETTPDPLDKLRLRLHLAEYFESKSNFAAASRVFVSLYKENPANLGIVRAIVDYYARREQPDRAIEVLLEASGRANQGLQRSFQMEAARRAGEAGRFEQALGILDGLLKANPLAADALSVSLDVLSKKGDEEEFRKRTLAAIDALRHSSLASDDRLNRIATLRRGLIPTLTRRKEFDGAVDQYIELINRFPEDAALTREASGYAVQHGLAAKLRSFYEQTAATADKDYRWPLVLARLSVAQENFPAAIGFASEALKRRPDRVDIQEDKAGWQERLLRFADASASYRKLYEMTWRDGQWMLKAAEMEARQGHVKEAFAAARLAVLGGRVEKPDTLLEVAGHLERWGMLPEAQEYAEKAAALTGPAFFQESSGAALCLRLRAKARRFDAVYAGLASAGRSSEALARSTGEVVASLCTPEEKAQLASFLEQQYAKGDENLRVSLLIPLVEAAKLEDLHARWRNNLLMSAPSDPGKQEPLIAVQTRRAHFAQLGLQLEAYWASIPADRRDTALLFETAEAYRSAGDLADETRVLAAAANAGAFSARYLDLLAAHDPQRLVALAGGALQDRYRAQAANRTLVSGRTGVALAAVKAWGASLPPVWTEAASALVGYFLDGRPNDSFPSLLDRGSIGERLGKPIDRKLQLAGDAWFYYGGIYGRALLHAGSEPQAESYLASEIEKSPAVARNYVALGDVYREMRVAARAIDAYRRSLQLDPNRCAAHDGIAMALAGQGQREEALAEWKEAIAALFRMQTKGGAVPESYWEDAEELFRHLGEQKAIGPLRSELAHLFRDYLDRNRAYKFEPLVSGAAQASLESGTGLDWLVALAADSENADTILSGIESCCELGAAQREFVWRQRIAVTERQAVEAAGYARAQRQGSLDEYRLNLAFLLLDNGRTADARRERNLLSGSYHEGRIGELDIRLAAREHTLDALFDAYRNRSGEAPQRVFLLTAAATLRREGAKQEGLKTLEYAYTREMERDPHDPSNFLGLAEVRLEYGDLPGAQAVLDRMALISGELFENFVPAAQLLERYGHREEAAQWFAKRVQAVPWDIDARISRLRLSPDQADLRAILDNQQATYEQRKQGAFALRRNGRHLDGETELYALTRDPIPAAAATKPYAAEARFQTAGGRINPLREALAIDPERADVRQALGEALLREKADAEAIAVLRPLVPKPEPSGEEYGYSRRRRGHSPSETTAEIAPDESRGTMFRDLAAAFVREGHLGGAAALYSAAIPLLGANAGSAKAALAEVENLVAAERENALRRPVLSSAIETARDVRPRITAVQARERRGR